MKSTNVDILQHDKKIKDYFSGRKDLKKEIISYVETFKRSLEDKRITEHTRELIRNKISEKEMSLDDIDTDVEYGYYVTETAGIIDEYKRLLRTPIKMSFTGKKQTDDGKRKLLIEKYMKIAKKYSHNISFSENECDILSLPEKDNSLVVCDMCKNKSEFKVVDEFIYICVECGNTQEIHVHTTSYTDTDRINISHKYKYDRRVHFRDSIKQYQGKQTSMINPVIYEQLEEQFKRHHLLVGDENTKRSVRFSNITKDHVLMFLKELGHCKQYENFVLIHRTMTGVVPDDISHLEGKLMDDFDKIAEAYDIMYKDIVRKNFLNTQYTLYCLLRKHKHPVDTSNLTLLKTIDRLDFHDSIMRKLFAYFGWVFHNN